LQGSGEDKFRTKYGTRRAASGVLGRKRGLLVSQTNSYLLYIGAIYKIRRASNIKCTSTTRRDSFTEFGVECALARAVPDDLFSTA
jgi:hypothetical protein